MSYTYTQDLALRLKPEIIAQNFMKLTPLKDGMEMMNVFRTTRNIDDTMVDVKKLTQEVKSIPYTAQAAQGVSVNGNSEADVKHSVPPMKIHAKILAQDFSKLESLKGIGLDEYLQDGPLREMRRSMDYSLEYLKRSMLTTGNLSYPYLLGQEWTTAALTLGTQYDGGTVSTKWDAAAKTCEQIWNDTRTAIRAAKNTTANSPFFQTPEDVVVYVTDTGFYNLVSKLNGRQNIDVLNTGIIDDSTVKINGYTYKMFPGAYVNPQTGSSVDAVTAKQVRIVDKSLAAQHTMAMLKLDNFEAKRSGNNHMLINVVPDPYGNYIDLMLEFRPVPLFTPEASIKLVTLT